MSIALFFMVNCQRDKALRVLTKKIPGIMDCQKFLVIILVMALLAPSTMISGCAATKKWSFDLCLKECMPICIQIRNAKMEACNKGCNLGCQQLEGKGGNLGVYME
ncbi:hypothetical protein CRG98_047581 [Punica granatum]|uniref:Uncharacterized protein n=1 Tax=Punica granatum TaxID=22663 RepID=A0A2I0HJZ4_PUNGR|nr:hypothetical protein CRG98_047581 [Punica granatum]